MATSENAINVGEDETKAALYSQNPLSPASASSDSDSDDSDSDSGAQLSLQLQTLESELSTNPSNYDAHVQYIRFLRKQGQIEKLRESREAMSELFPLSPVMWQEWAKDEASLASSRPEAAHSIEKLYERGVFDYLSVPLWCDYLNFVQEYDPSIHEHTPDGILRARNLFERAVIAAGLHLLEGGKIWEAYREFEQANFHAIDETNVEAKEKQIQRIRSIFHRQLSVPLVDLRATLHAYKAWEIVQGNVLDINSENLDEIPSHVASAYRKALEMYSARAKFEEQIAAKIDSDSDRLQQFMTYIKYEEASGDPARVQILYERACADFPISSDIWLQYTRYLDRTIKVGNVVRDVYSRATKNCPWIGELWTRYLLSMERGHVPEKEIFIVFEKSLQCTFSSFDEYLDLFLTRIDGLRRRLSAPNEGDNILHFSLIRDTFQHASDYLAPHMKNTGSFLHLYAYWAFLELNLGKDLGAARGVWESLLKINGSLLEAWKDYVAMEIGTGHINEARSIYRRCYCRRFPEIGSEDICQSWLRFERECGTLEDFDYAVQKVTPRLDELRSFRVQQESKSVAASKDQKADNLKRKQASNVVDEQPVAKRQKNAKRNLKNVPEKAKTQALNKDDTNVVGIKDKAEKAELENEQRREHSFADKTKFYTDQCTAFVSNLSLKANYNDLQKFFSDVGGVVAIRILNDKYTGKSRGLAYVDFSDEAHLAAAVKKNKQTLLGKKVSIARSNPNKSKNKGTIRLSASMEHGKSSGSAGGRRGSDSKPTIENTVELGEPQATSSSAAHDYRTDSIQLKRKNTFAVPRTVMPLGWTSNRPKTEHEEDEKPKSNDEFRKMLLKS